MLIVEPLRAEQTTVPANLPSYYALSAAQLLLTDLQIEERRRGQAMKYR
jgi:hypothetical protein